MGIALKFRILQSDSLFQGYSIQNSYTNTKQCKMYGNLFVQKEEKFVLK